MTSGKPLSFPHQFARTQRFTLGAPRAFTVAPDGSRVVFLRSTSGTDRTQRLWVLDLDGTAGSEVRTTTGDGRERMAADPGTLLGGAGENLSAEERARRERSREGSAGIVQYAADAAVDLIAFALSGRLYAAELRTRTVYDLPAPGPVIDPRPSPDGRHIAYVARDALRVIGREGGGDRVVAGHGDDEDPQHISYGMAEFIAAEEMHRSRGYWWAPESDRLLVARVDTAEVQRWWISDPAHPDRDPASVVYPAAGTPNASVRLFVVGLDGARTEVTWDRARHPYLARVHWSAAGPPLLLVQARDQRRQLYLAVDTESGATRTVHEEQDPAWLQLFPGVPAWAPDGRLVRIADEEGVRVLVVGEQALTGPRLQPQAVLDVGEDDLLVSATVGEAAADPETGEMHVYRVDARGVERFSEDAGVHSAVRAGGVTVLSSARTANAGTSVRVFRDGKQITTIASYAEPPVLSARVRLTEAGARRIPSAVLLPAGYQDTDGRLPVLLDPYSGPLGRRVLAAHNAYLTSQWFADQGFAVIVADGRGTPGRSPGWEKAIKNNLLLALDDQIEALRDLAGRFPLDTGRVAIRGWSFGGYLAALAVLRRPDVFHAAVVGAPVTDWRLYDTHYTERYLGAPHDAPEVYAANSLVIDGGLSSPENPARPMMIIHGMADDNVVVAHSLRLSAALLAAGRAHEVLPLSGVTHMTPHEQIAENMLLLQVDFLKRSLVS